MAEPGGYQHGRGRQLVIGNRLRADSSRSPTRHTPSSTGRPPPAKVAQSDMVPQNLFHGAVYASPASLRKCSPHNGSKLGSNGSHSGDVARLQSSTGRDQDLIVLRSPPSDTEDLNAAERMRADQDDESSWQKLRRVISRQSDSVTSALSPRGSKSSAQQRHLPYGGHLGSGLGTDSTSDSRVNVSTCGWLATASDMAPSIHGKPAAAHSCWQPMPPQAPAQVKLQQYTAQLTALDAQLRDSPSRPAARGMDPAPGPPGCTGTSFSNLLGQLHTSTLPRSEPASGLTYAMAAVPVPRGGCQPAATVQHTSQGSTATLLPTSPASWQQGLAHSLPAATHTATLPACSPTSLEQEAEALLQRVRATLLPAGGPLPVPEAGGRGRPGPAHSSCQAVWDEGTLAGAEDIASVQGSSQMPRVAGEGQEHSSAAHDWVSRLGASSQLKHNRAGPAAAAVPAQPGAGRTAATARGPRPGGSSRLAQPGPPAAAWARGAEEEGWDTWPIVPVGRGAGQAPLMLLEGLLSAAAQPSSTDTMTATARRIIEGAQLQMLQLQFLQRESELCQQQQEHAVQSAELASVSEHAAGQAGARIADEVPAAAAASTPRSQCWPPPGAEQDGVAGEEPGRGDMAAGRLARLHLLLRRWRRNTVEARQHQCRLLVYMACRRMCCLLHAWCLVTLSPAALQGVVPAGGGADLEELRLQRQRQHQVATCFHRLWLQHAVLQHWHLVHQQLYAARQAEQRKALQDGQQLQAEQQYWEVASRFRVAYVQHSVLRAWLAAAKAAALVRAADLDAARRKASIAGFLARVAGGATGALLKETALLVETHEGRMNVGTDLDTQQHSEQACCAQPPMQPPVQPPVEPPVQPPHQERAPYDVRTKDKLTAGLAAGRALMLRRQQQQQQPLSAQELVPARQQEVLQQPCQQQLAPLPLPAVPRPATAPQAEATRSNLGQCSRVRSGPAMPPSPLMKTGCSQQPAHPASAQQQASGPAGYGSWAEVQSIGNSSFSCSQGWQAGDPAGSSDDPATSNCATAAGCSGGLEPHACLGEATGRASVAPGSRPASCTADLDDPGQSHTAAGPHSIGALASAAAQTAAAKTAATAAVTVACCAPGHQLSSLPVEAGTQLPKDTGTATAATDAAAAVPATVLAGEGIPVVSAVSDTAAPARPNPGTSLPDMSRAQLDRAGAGGRRGTSDSWGSSSVCSHSSRGQVSCCPSSAGSSSSVFGDTSQAPASLAYNQHGAAVARKPTSAADGGSSCSERCSRTAAGPSAAKGKSEHKPGVWAKPAPTAPRPRVASCPTVSGSGVVTDQMAASLGKGNLAVAAAQGDVTAERLLAQARAAAQRRRRSTQQEVQVAMEALLAEAQLLAELHYQRALLQRCGLKPWLRLWHAEQARQRTAACRWDRRCLCLVWTVLRQHALRRHWQVAGRQAAGVASQATRSKARLARACLRGLTLWWRARCLARARLMRPALQALAVALRWGRLAARDARLHERGHRLRSTLRAWRAEVLRQANVQLAFELDLLHVAAGHHARSLTRTGLTAWRLAVRQAADEREAENHKAATWSKINSWLQEHHGRRSHTGEGLKYGGTKDVKLGDITLSELPPSQPPASSMAPASASLALNDAGGSSPLPQPTLHQASHTVHTRHTATWASKGGGGGTQHPEDLHAGCQLEQGTALARSLTDGRLLSLAEGPAPAIPSLLGPLGADRLLPPPQPHPGPLQPAWAWPAAGVGGGVEWWSSGGQSIWLQQDPGAQGAPTAPQQASFQAATQGQAMCAPALHPHQPITTAQCKHQLQVPGTAASDRCPKAGSSNHVQGACGLGGSNGHCRQGQAGRTLAAAAQALRSQRLQRYMTQKHSQPQHVHKVEHGT